MNQNPKTGLLLEGGSMRGLYTAGILDVMMEHDIRVDGMIAVSAGATFGVNFKSRQIGRTIRYNTRFARDPRYCSLWSLLTTGDLYGAEFDYYRLPEELDPFAFERFSADPTEFYAVVTDVDTGKPVYHRLTDLHGEGMEWIRASASMPVASRPVEIGGHKYLDGGCSDAIPIHWWEEEAGYRKNIIILTQPEEYVKNPMRGSSILEVLLHDYPNLSDSLNNLHISYNECLRHIAEQEAAGNAFVFRPDEALEVGKIEHDPNKMKKTYETGRRIAEARMPELLAFLG